MQTLQTYIQELQKSSDWDLVAFTLNLEYNESEDYRELYMFLESELIYRGLDWVLTQ
jgi:hypothetical protein